MPNEDSLRQLGQELVKRVIVWVGAAVVVVGGLLFANDNRQTSQLSSHTTELAVIQVQQKALSDRMDRYETGLKELRDMIAGVERTSNNNSQELRGMLNNVSDKLSKNSEDNRTISAKLTEALSRGDIKSFAEEVKPTKKDQ